MAQHLAVAGEESIDIRAVRRMLARGQLVLLFDGFDELAIQVTYDRAAEHLRTILTAVTGRAKVVLSSRTQHFASDTQWRTTLGDEVHLVAGSRLVELGDFADSQIRDFLSRLYGGDTSAADRRLELIRDIKDLLGLSRNPRMLSFIADLDEDELRAVRAAGGGISSAYLYENLIARWLRFEVNRRRPTLGAIPGLGVDQIRRAVTALTLQLWRGAERDMDLSRLEETARPDRSRGLGPDGLRGPGRDRHRQGQRAGGHPAAADPQHPGPPGRAGPARQGRRALRPRPAVRGPLRCRPDRRAAPRRRSDRREPDRCPAGRRSAAFRRPEPG
ncbi:hypothetical protein [Frankia sp. Cas3]|uniref:NACHT domain-containing protein n=1 Tax=Frankia sp. Cas3 TaxID=3073926 RepID=UPI002AD3EA95|nr:hypothetical protein [Frankia sp. Cas3]